jgi:hypothetical protein
MIVTHNLISLILSNACISALKNAFYFIATFLAFDLCHGKYNLVRGVYLSPTLSTNIDHSANVGAA